ncbi:DUF3099 domain-containing protein [Nocardioides sp.]|uniref:DUF3099 domain-containing protein n=1 Tax=Nocardioides sp. TaxID=35761 RepID=UPI003517D3D0
MTPSDQAQRRRRYFQLMGTSLVLILLAWNVVRLWSVPAAIAMSAVAAILAPVASIVGNRGAIRRLQGPRPPAFPPREADDDGLR